MGLPTVAVLDEEIGARDGSSSAAEIIGQTNGSADLGSHHATLEERAKKALECPCLDDLRSGPCGGEFSKAFLCFVKSQQPEKGSDCIEPFEKMQHCMSKNSNKFLSPKNPQTDTAMPTEGHKPSPEEDESEAEREGDDDEDNDDDEEVNADYSTHGLVPAPPAFPNVFVRLPPWYPQQNSDSKQSR